jgi:hypothetical protein
MNMNINISSDLTSRWIKYLNQEGERWKILLPLMYLIGIPVALLGDTVLVATVLTLWACTAVGIFIRVAYTGVGMFITYTLEKNQDDNTLWTPPRNAWLEPFIYAFAPLSYLGKLLHDTFKPFKYKSSFEVIRTLKQPIEGLALILTGIWRVITSPLIAISEIFLTPFAMISSPAYASTFLGKVPGLIGTGVTGLVNGFARIVAGSVELALTPFTLLVKPVIRFAIGAMLNENQKPNIINNNGIKSRIAIAQTQQIKRMAALHDENEKNNSAQQSSEAALNIILRLNTIILNNGIFNRYEKPANNSEKPLDIEQYIFFTYADVHRKFLESFDRGERVDPQVVLEETEHYKKLTGFRPDYDKSINENWEELNTLENNYAGVFFNNRARQVNVGVYPIEEEHLISSANHSI